MFYTTLALVLFLSISGLSFDSPAQDQEKFPEIQFVVKPLSSSVQVQTKCGEFFGFNEYPGVEKCISFNYESDDNLFIRTVAISTVRTEIDAGKEEPTVQFSTPSEIIIRITQEDYDKEKNCLPEPKAN